MMLHLLQPILLLSTCLILLHQVASVPIDDAEELLQLLNQLKSEHAKSLQQRREQFLWQPLLDNQILDHGTEHKSHLALLKRQNSHHMRIRLDSDRIGSHQRNGKRNTWVDQPQEDGVWYSSFDDELSESEQESHLKAVKRPNSQHLLWTMLGDTLQSDRGSSHAPTGKRSQIFKRPSAQHLLWGKVGSTPDDRISQASAAGKRSSTGMRVKGRHMFVNTIGDLYRDRDVLGALRSSGNGDETMSDQPSRFSDDNIAVEDILRHEELNDF